MKKLFLKQNRKQLLIILIAFALIEAVLNTVIIHQQSYQESFNVLFIALPAIAFILGSVIALIPFKQLNYINRWLTMSLIIIFACESYAILGYAIILFRIWFHI